MSDEQAVERGSNYDWQHEAKHYRDECDKLRELLRSGERSSDRLAAELDHVKTTLLVREVELNETLAENYAFARALREIEGQPPLSGQWESRRLASEALSQLSARTKAVMEECTESERAFWIAKFEHWVKCQEGGATINHIKASGFSDCINAMKKNDRWIPAEALQALDGKGEGMTNDAKKPSQD